MAAVSGLAFAPTPSGRVWNVRFLPLWFLWLCLLAGYGLARGAEALGDLRRRWATGAAIGARGVAGLAVPVVALAAMLPLWDSRLGRGVLSRERGDFTTVAELIREDPQIGRPDTLIRTFRSNNMSQGGRQAMGISPGD